MLRFVKLIGKEGLILMARISKDWVGAYFDHGVDITNRFIFLTGEIDEHSSGNVIQGMYLMDQQNEKHDPIELRISSYGGDVYDMMGVHDVTRTLKSPVHTFGIGKIMSAATLLVACGEKGNRWCGPNTTFMVHVPWWGSNGENLNQHNGHLEHVKKFWERWYDLMAKYTNKPKSFWKKLCAKPHDAYFGAEEALEWGVIDNIWDEKEGE